jgi:selenocysteine lyase/cysteine desulfurase
MSGGPDDADRVRTLREALTATGAGIYLATHVAGPLSAETLAAVHESDELELRIGRVGPDRAEDLEQREWEARAAVAATIRAPFEQVVLSHGAAEAARGITLELLGARVSPPQPDTRARADTHPGAGARPGPGARTGLATPTRVVIVEGLAEPVARAVESVTRALGAEVDHLSVAPQILGSDVALVAMPHVDPLGRLHDPGPVASTTHRAGGRLLVDISLSVGALPLDVAELGADALVGDVHRWLLGPEGLALAWLSPALGDDLPVRLRATTGPFARGPLLGLARSVGWLLMYVELPWAVTRTGRLARRLYGSLASIHGVELVTDRAAHAGLLAFRIIGWDAEQAAEELSRSAFAITDVESDADVIRVSVGAWNREDELDRFVERVAELAAHSPASLPRRPSLTILSGPLDHDR